MQYPIEEAYDTTDTTMSDYMLHDIFKIFEKIRCTMACTFEVLRQKKYIKNPRKDTQHVNFLMKKLTLIYYI